MSNTQEIEFADMQGLLRFAHGHLNESCFLLLTVQDAVAARAWLRDAPVCTAAKSSPLPERAMQVAFSVAGLRSLGLDETIIDQFSEEFIGGMAGDGNRSRRLGDINKNDPGEWEWGGTENELPHLLLALYARKGDLDTWRQHFQEGVFSKAFETRAVLNAAILEPDEPFGFADGVSQPAIDWHREMSTDQHKLDRYSNLLATGEVVLGYPNEYGLYTSRPLPNPTVVPNAKMLPAAEDEPTLKDLGRNGSYVVMRQLSQDVPGFWQFIDRAANSNAETRENLAAAMVGRERDGTPLVDLAIEPIKGIENDRPRVGANQFNFEGDPHGQRCPVGAHIRRSNPRTGDFPVGVVGTISRLVRTFGFGRRYPEDDLIASSRFHRILRRGRTYGSTIAPEDAVKPDAPEAERGLHFICLCANITRQFEFVQNAWSMSSKFAGLSTQSDPLLGNREPLLNSEDSARFTLPSANGPAQCVNGLPQFVTVRGGAYFFMPGIRALQYIASEPSSSAVK